MAMTSSAHREYHLQHAVAEPPRVKIAVRALLSWHAWRLRRREGCTELSIPDWPQVTDESREYVQDCLESGAWATAADRAPTLDGPADDDIQFTNVYILFDCVVLL